MRFTKQQKQQIFDRTDGRCHICYKGLIQSHYGAYDKHGGWNIDHSKPQAKGGSHHLNNLYPTCCSCNSSKGARSNRTARLPHGKTRAPLSAAAKKQKKQENALDWGVIAATTGGLLFGPVGLVLGAACGGTIGHSINPEDS